MPEGVIDPQFLPVGETVDDSMRPNRPDHEDDGSDDGEDDDVRQMAEETQLRRVPAQTKSPHRLNEGRENPPANSSVDYCQGYLGGGMDTVNEGEEKNH